MDKRVAIHTNVTPEARDGWDRFSEEHGVSFTGITEAIGRRMAADVHAPDLVDLAAEARKIDAERRRK